jgi:serine/threonine protein kinase
MSDDIETRLQQALEGHYKLERELGRGAMARVFLATDLRHGREVALKLLPPEMATATSAERFLREIRITAGLQHPHILPLLDSGAAGGLCWYVMPRVMGESLREKLAQGPLPLKDALRIGGEVGKALAYAHSQTVVHRDIKPENIMLSGGQAIVMDFGLARALGGSGTNLTATGMPIGTPAYMSPEQVMGADEIDARSDIYSLGCLVYEMTTGRPPFAGASLAVVLRQQVQEMPVPPSQVNPAVPSYVDKIVAKALAKQPAGRYQKAEEMVAQLEMASAMATLGDMGMAEPEEEDSGEADEVKRGKGGWRKLFGR